MSRRILIVEDEPGLVLTLIDRLVSEGYSVESAANADKGFARARDELFDLILLDVMLPGGNGFDLCRDLRQHGIATPIIMLTARGQIVDRVLGLKIGADDYITKPFEEIELLARIEALLRRIPTQKSDTLPGVYSFGTIKIDFHSTAVENNGLRLNLSAREFKLLRYLIEHRGQTLSRDRLLNEVWGYDAMPTTRTVDVHIAGLRQKIEPNPSNPQYIETVYGFGYKFLG